MVADGPDAVDWLLSLGTAFDRDEETGELALGREAAHSRRRVLHAGGDATGAEIERALVAAVRSRANVQILECAFAIDLIVADGACTGVLIALGSARRSRWQPRRSCWRPVARVSFGQRHRTRRRRPRMAWRWRFGRARPWPISSFASSTRPSCNSRAGLRSSSLKRFAVKAPTCGITPANRFMLNEHELAELAPRDIVARGIQKQMVADGADHVFLDLRHLDGPKMRRRFPTIARELDTRGLDLATDLIPVAPAAHYFMGGVVAEESGVTSLPGLLAVGEAACTGVHGANRLASNSLLEGLVFGRKAAAGLRIAPGGDSAPIETQSPDRELDGHETNLAEIRSSIQQTMSRYVSVVRDQAGLTTAIAELEQLSRQLPAHPGDRDAWITANMVLAAHAIASAALFREESRGAHFRSDFPARDSALDGLHYIYQSDNTTEGEWSLDRLSAVIRVARR